MVIITFLFDVGLAQFFVEVMLSEVSAGLSHFFCLCGSGGNILLSWRGEKFVQRWACAVFCWSCAVGVSCWALAVFFV